MQNDYVTERELKANLDPLRADIWEIRADVKTLVLAAAQAKGAQEQAKKNKSRRVQVSDRRLAWGAVAAGLLAPLAWLNIPNPFH